MKTKLAQSLPRSAGLPLEKAAAKRNGKAPRLARILVPTDFSSESKKAVEYALAFARRFGASITLLHVVELKTCAADFGYGPVTIQISSKEKLKQAKAKLNLLGRKMIGNKLLAETLALSGTAYFEITEAAKALQTDLIIMGTHGDAPKEITPMGSTAERVVRHAHCPVFVVRKREHEFAL
jgi:nucleotide-binding universal stress UspA family protein